MAAQLRLRWIGMALRLGSEAREFARELVVEAVWTP